MVKEGETLFCFRKVAVDHSIERCGAVCYQGGMYVQWGTLDNEGERFRGKDAAGMVSGTSCLDYLDLTCCLTQTFVELEAVRMNAVNEFLDNEKMQPKIDTPEVQMHASECMYR